MSNTVRNQTLQTGVAP